MNAHPNLFAVARLVGDPSRAAILSALLDGRARSATDLAYRARISPQTASSHLAKLIDAGLLAVERHGRHRYYRLADPAVAERLEALAVLGPPGPARPERGRVPEGLRAARTCYDHLAGRLGVALADALTDQGLLVAHDGSFELTAEGARRLAAFGLDLDALRRQRRRFAPCCLDWSERRHHLGGALGAALTAQLFARGWLQRAPSSRAVRLTEAGAAGLAREFGLAAP